MLSIDRYSEPGRVGWCTARQMTPRRELRDTASTHAANGHSVVSSHCSSAPRKVNISSGRPTGKKGTDSSSTKDLSSHPIRVPLSVNSNSASRRSPTSSRCPLRFWCHSRTARTVAVPTWVAPATTNQSPNGFSRSAAPRRSPPLPPTPPPPLLPSPPPPLSPSSSPSVGTNPKPIPVKVSASTSEKRADEVKLGLS